MKITETPTIEIADIATVAQNEAGHAVMRWLCGLQVTGLIAREDGSGFCYGTGRRVDPITLLWITLAGPAAEAIYNIIPLDWERTRFDDFDEARRLIDPWHKWEEDEVENALHDQFAIVCERLWPFAGLVDDLAARLEVEGTLSARSVAALCREYKKRVCRAISPEEWAARQSGRQGAIQKRIETKRANSSAAPDLPGGAER